jgi:phosphoheptose isomerase
VRTYPLQRRENLVALDDFIFPEGHPERRVGAVGRPGVEGSFDSVRQTPPDSAQDDLRGSAQDDPRDSAQDDLREVAGRIVAAREAGRPVIWMIGGHVVKSGLAPVIIHLMERGVITHLASNGAATIHDFEIALLGHTSEDVARSLEDGSFGMAEETGSFMNRAIRAGARDGIGMGEALGRWLAETPGFDHREYSLLYNAYRLGVPYTAHVAIGTDIIHQHPEADFAATGFATGHDFKVVCAAVCELEGGVFCNFGSAVMGPEVFLKAVSVARNLGHPLREITTANFDLLPLSGDYRTPSPKDDPEYYYRPKKNIVIRPVSLGGKGYHIVGDHRATIPALARITGQRMEADKRIATDKQRDPASISVYPLVSAASDVISRSFRTGGTLFLCGNGGSFADALHIAGELNKRFRRPRPIPPGHAARLAALPGGEMLAARLESAMRAIALGANPSLASAIDNDSPEKGLGFAQELYSLARPGDVLLAISTSGGASNVLNAVTVARALGLTVIALTGPRDSRLSAEADIVLRGEGAETAEIQQQHICIYHELCDLLEAALVGN